jgi:membrane peptidoglycan carboxypeptidase
VAELDITQSAFLAGMIASPTRFDPIRFPEAAKQRRGIALGRLAAVDRLTADEAAFLTAAPMPTQINQFNPEP